MAIQSAVARHYAYNPQTYNGVLLKIHDKVKSNLEKSTLANNAFELQTLLQEIKQTARLLNKQPLTSVEIELVNQDEDLIMEMLSIQNIARASYKTKTGKRMSADLISQALFNRRNATKTIQGADNIFEEELAALMAALEKKFTGSGNIYKYLAGGRSAEVMAMTDKDMSEDIKLRAISAMQETADIMEKKYEAKKLMKGRSQKIDTDGFHEDLTVGIDINENKLAKLAYYLKDATFSAKQYTR